METSDLPGTEFTPLVIRIFNAISENSNTERGNIKRISQK